jgi:FKBP-type peptidyl-prolyl cis-trans isomerase 2
MRKKMSKVETGSNISVHYVGLLEDGTKFDSSHDRGETLTFSVGQGQTIAGFENAVVGMSKGESKTVTLTADQAYGPVNPEATQTIPLTSFPEEVTLSEGVTVVGQNEAGQQMMAKVITLTDTDATLDFNHPLAGKDLTFEIELVEIN